MDPCSVSHHYESSTKKRQGPYTLFQEAVLIHELYISLSCLEKIFSVFES